MRALDLYQISYDGVVYYLTSASTAQTHDGQDYVPTSIGRGGTQSKQELTKANLEVRLELGHALAQKLLQQWAELPATITVFSKRTAGTEVIWKGRLASTQPGDAEIKMTFESIYTSLRRPGLRARFLKHCRHPLYARGCWVNPEDFATPATLAAISGNTLTIPQGSDQAPGWYSGGMIRDASGALTYITKHDGTAFLVNRVPRSILADFQANGPATAVTLYPGCDHTYATCQSKFANDLNYGGFDFIPTKNPMGGSSIV